MDLNADLVYFPLSDTDKGRHMNIKDAIIVMLQSRIDELSNALKKAMLLNSQIKNSFNAGKLALAEGIGEIHDSLLIAQTSLNAIRDFVPVLEVKSCKPYNPPVAPRLNAEEEKCEEPTHKTTARKAYHFTFGSSHPLRNRVQRIWATSECKARETMVKFYGDKWASCYGPDERLIECRESTSGILRGVHFSIGRRPDDEPISQTYYLTDNDLFESAD